MGEHSHRPRPAGGNADRSREACASAGSPGKAYIKVGQKLADLAPQLTAGALKIEVVPTGGSLDNLGKALAGECDARSSPRATPSTSSFVRCSRRRMIFRVVGELYTRSSLLLCRRDTGIDDLDEAEDAVIAADNMGTGSLATMLNLKRLDPDDYGEIKDPPSEWPRGRHGRDQRPGTVSARRDRTPIGSHQDPERQ